MIEASPSSVSSQVIHSCLTWRCVVTGDFLLELMQSLSGTKKMTDLLNFVISIMKHNAVYLKEDAVAGIIR